MSLFNTPFWLIKQKTHADVHTDVVFDFFCLEVHLDG